MTTAQSQRPPARIAAAEILLVFLIFFVFAGWPPPDLNEAHYLAKAKHFWNSQWCPRDQFLQSADAHLVFYWTLGWLTRVLPLPAVAWIGRIVTWALLAVSWRRLSYTVVPVRGFGILSAALAICLWSRCHMAGEWVVGGVEAKGIAYVFVFLALASLTAGYWRRVWPLLGAASAFHVLVGGWSVIAAAVAWLLSPRGHRPVIRSMVPALIGGLFLSLPGVIPALLLNWGTDPTLVWQADRIYVFRRLAHHLVLHEFPVWLVIRHLSLLLVWCGLSWRLVRSSSVYRRLSAFVAGAVLIALAGAVVDLWTRPNPFWGGFWLRYYWFRLSDAMLPVGVALGAGVLVCQWRRPRPATSQWLLVALIGLSAISLGDQAFRRRQDPRPAADIQGHLADASADDVRAVYAAWRDVCHWIRVNTPTDVCVLTPLRQQTFKWYAQRSELVNWKDVPQDAIGLHEWWKRFRQVRQLDSPAVTAQQYRQRVIELVQQYDLQYVLVVHSAKSARCGLPLVYRNARFAVYQVVGGKGRQGQGEARRQGEGERKQKTRLS